MISHRLVTHLLRTSISGDISKEGADSICKFIEDLIELISYFLSRRLAKINHYRSIQGLPPIKRIPKSEYLNLSMKLFNEISELLHGEIGQSNSDTILSKADTEVS